MSACFKREGEKEMVIYNVLWYSMGIVRLSLGSVMLHNTEVFTWFACILQVCEVRHCSKRGRP